MSEQKFMSNLNGYEIRDAYARENILTEEDALMILVNSEILMPAGADETTLFTDLKNRVFVL